MTTENLIDRSTFCKSSVGNPLKITIGIPENKVNRKSVQQLSFKIIRQL